MRMRLVCMDADGTLEELGGFVRSVLNAQAQAADVRACAPPPRAAIPPQAASSPVRHIAARGTKRRITAPALQDAEPDQNVQVAVYQSLNNGPLTSLEAFELTRKLHPKTTAGSVYQTLRTLLGKGVVEKVTRDDESVAWKQRAA